MLIILLKHSNLSLHYILLVSPHENYLELYEHQLLSLLHSFYTLFAPSFAAFHKTSSLLSLRVSFSSMRTNSSIKAFQLLKKTILMTPAVQILRASSQRAAVCKLWLVRSLPGCRGRECLSSQGAKPAGQQGQCGAVWSRLWRMLCSVSCGFTTLISESSDPCTSHYCL